jgi:hypothetical protein
VEYIHIYIACRRYYTGQSSSKHSTNNVFPIARHTTFNLAELQEELQLQMHPKKVKRSGTPVVSSLLHKSQPTTNSACRLQSSVCTYTYYYYSPHVF